MRIRLILSKALVFLFVVLLLTLALQQARSQDIFGTINGTVTDTSGAVVPKAKVTITNEATQISRTVTADDKGYYVATDVPVGTYTVTVDMDKFKTIKKTGNVLVAGGHLTVDVKLEVGAVTETVEVTATGVALNTSSAEVSRTVGSKELLSASLNERNYVQLITLMPGAVLTTFDQTTLTTGQAIAPANINGLRTDGNLLTVDGGYNLDSGSNGTQLNNVGINFIHEVTIETSNYSAEYGRSAASSVNVVTNSGGNQFHGDLFEYGRNNDFDAKPAFSTLQELRFNDFGGDLGGPIIKHKLFFFGGIEWKRLVLPGDGPPKSLTLPTSPELIGNFADTGLTLKAQGTVTAASGCIGSYSGGPKDTNPLDFVPNTVTGTGTAINPSCITSGGKAIANIYNLMETPGASPESAATFTNAATANNATFAPVTPQNWQEAILRLDYIPTDNHSLYIRGLQDHLLLVDPFGPFSPGGALPTSPQLRIRPGYGVQVGDVWTVSPHLVNEAKFNVSWNQQRIPEVVPGLVESSGSRLSARYATCAC
ncbi:MAG: carboxypeptidase regulatory-like domain-containing protein [Candidatus Acidiferrales bacterium]